MIRHDHLAARRIIYIYIYHIPGILEKRAPKITCQSSLEVKKIKRLEQCQPVLAYRRDQALDAPAPGFNAKPGISYTGTFPCTHVGFCVFTAITP
jgi:hypothetical protein